MLWGRDRRWVLVKGGELKRRELSLPPTATTLLWEMGPKPGGRRAGHAYLVHLVPLGTKVLFDDLALEDLVANTNNAIGVWLALDKSLKVGVLALKILSFNEVYPQNALESRGTNAAMPHRLPRDADRRWHMGDRAPLLCSQEERWACGTPGGSARETKAGAAHTGGEEVRRGAGLLPHRCEGTGQRSGYMEPCSASAGSDTHTAGCIRPTPKPSVCTDHFIQFLEQSYKILSVISLCR